MTETNATTTPPAGPPRFPPGRYGRRRDPRHGVRRRDQILVAAMALVVILVGFGAAIQLGQRYGTGRAYDPAVVRFYDITDHQVVIEFRVTVPEGEAAFCAVRARAADGGQVGREEVRVDPPAGTTRPQVTHTLATSERAVTGEVQRCWRDR